MELSIFLKSIVRIFDIYSDTNIPDDINAVIDQIRAWNLKVSNYSVEETQEGYLLKAEVPYGNSQPDGFELPGLPGFFVSFNQEPGRSYFYIKVIVPYDEDDNFIILKDLQFNFRYGNDSVLSDGVKGFTISVKADIKVDSDFKFEFQSFSATCDQQLRLFNNDIFFRCEGFQFNFDEESDRIPFKTLPEDGRKGIFSKKVTVGMGANNIFQIDKPVDFAFRQLFITKNGISFQFHQHFYGDVLNNILDPASEFACNLLAGRINAAITGVLGKVANNDLDHIAIEGFLKIPVLDLFASFGAGLLINDGAAQLTASLDSIEAIDLNMGVLRLLIGKFSLDGMLRQDEVSLSGTATDIRIQLNPIDLSLAACSIHIDMSEDCDEISFDIDSLPVPLFGFLRDTSLAIRQDKAGDSPVDTISIKGKVRWADIKNRMGGTIPVLADSDNVEVSIVYKKDPGTGTDQVDVRILVGLADPSAAWDFLPASFRPQIRNAQSSFTIHYDNVGAFANADTSSPLNASAGFVFECRLPDILQIPSNPIFNLNTSDEAGWMQVSMNINTDAANVSTASISISDPLTLGINFPGLPQPEQPISISLDSISFLTGQDADGTMKFEMSGSFRFLPLDLPGGFVISDHIESLLGNFTGPHIAGSAKLSIDVKGELSQVKIECNFDDASFSVDIFDLIANLSKGMHAAAGIQEPSHEVDLDIPVSFGLKGFSIQFGSVEEHAAERESLKFSVDFNFSILEISSIVSFTLSDKICRIGFKNLSIPLRFPKFPVSQADINGGPWNNIVAATRSEVQESDELATRLEGLLEAIATRVDIPSCLIIFNAFYARLRMQGLPSSVVNRVNVYANVIGTTGEFISYEKLRSAIEAIQKILQRYAGEIKLRNALLVTADEVRQRLTDDPARNNFHNLLNGFLSITDAITGVFYQDTDLQLLIRDAGILIPFNDPRSISIEGGAELTGMQPGDPLHSLEGIQLGLGLSTERIYFFAKSMGNPIPIRIGTYDAGSVSFTHFSIGYGFTKNSFSTSFGGKLEISNRLQDDADSSDNLGIGFRLPSHTSLAFRFDIIIPPPPAPIPVPYIEFDLDMQKPGLVAIADPKTCSPNWDGFQFIIDHVFRIAFKRIAFSPFFGPIPLLNYRYAYDLSIGDRNNGMTVICDNFLVMYGIGTPPNTFPIPFFVDPGSPYFDNLCVHMQLAGFEMNYHLQRPFPQFNPLAIFEILGLLSDPMMPVDPKGPLANIVKVALTDTYIRVPEWVLFLAPSLKDINQKEVNLVINLGTVITAFQQIFTVLQQMQQTLQSAGESIRLKIDQVANLLEDPDIGKAIALIPPELRKLRTEANFGGFMGKAILVITDANDKEFLKSAFRKRDGNSTNSASNNFRLRNIGDPVSATETANFKVLPMPLEPGQRRYDPADDINELFKGIEFEQFSDIDIDQFPVPARPMPGIIGGAMLRIFNQRYRFLGAIFEDGSFGMITALSIEPLRLNISGIKVELGLAIRARLTLSGRRERNRYYASVTGESYANWEPIGGVFAVTLGERRKKLPVRIKIDGKGKFSVKGAASVSLHNGAAKIEGNIDADNDHCFIDGVFTYSPGTRIGAKKLVFLEVNATTKLGPGRKFLLSGGAKLEILDHVITRAKASISDEGATVEFQFDSGNWRIGTFVFPIVVSSYFKGAVHIQNRLLPNFNFTGKGSLVIKNPDAVSEDLFKVNGELELGYTHSRKLFLAASGQVAWAGLNWIGGGIELAKDHIRLFGDTKFVIQITPSNFGNIDFASVSLQFEMNGSVQINSNGVLKLKVKGKWLLGVSGAGESRAYPIASQRIDIPNLTIGTGGVNLINISNLDFLPVKDPFEIFIPKNDNDGGIKIYSLYVDLGPAGQYTMLMPFKPEGAEYYGRIPFIGPDLNWKKVSLKNFLAKAVVKVDLICENWQLKLRVKVGDVTKTIPL